MALARRRETVRLTAPLAVLSLASLVGTGLAPSLAVSHPLLLVALCPRSVYVLAAAAHAPLLPLLVVAAVRMMIADPLHFRLGQLHGAALGRRAARWFPVAKVGVPAVAASPTGKVLALAGAAGAAPARVAAADLAGTALRVVALCGAGRAVAPWTSAAVEALVPLTALVPMVVVVAVAAGVVVRRGLPAWTTTEATCVSW